ncbi:MAG: polysulfide reductase [Stygiobacter sp. RIFOXYC12_FULL_38_8]|nr:MAG: polysulfide reductase [Stygiobacter sp. GWC2_38_9]OGU83211.1 MAG: polysulfide reductase [Stygiobacter sp. RIFOXYA12_FULL_38_9]OGV07334.1 MAG: polysulfide reductase [Stygiobacter sp. RIFOXYB2_FULL_37_11]OGV10102.1 MAG: polysulfide reductase [Stygiobacter sp. RIFOXYA2_FULL_38_8]OGV15764.1 MAG: polysulfide reductase [Stygiobacter sp. RIFOXYC2_FULL_38_25]OGV28363.1 MAG: polysulfide reductase [Stygiobacter sp. RIFOXYC12_FULL_38_8]OGV80878.1 MAG: polysulfide reductase [Stygiobacter sp. GWF2
MENHKPTPIEKKYFTPVVIGLAVIALNGMLFLLARFIFGIGAVTNLDNQHPWGIWIGVDVAAGVALAAGGFTTAALGHIMHKDQYHAIIRPALLTAALGYTFVAVSVMIDLGRPYFIWHPLLMWNGSSVLFEVGICVMIYLTVLYIEFLPIITERFIGRVNLPGFLKKFNQSTDKLLRVLDKGLEKTMFIFIIAGVVLSCLHQSSLGTLMVIAGPKMHPLWQTPILPLLFLLSAISVGFPMVIMESLITSRSFNLKPETNILSDLGSMVAPLLGIYLAFKVGDMVIRQTFVYLTEISTASVMFTLEMVLGIVIPLRIFLSRSLSKTPLGLFIASILVVLGVLMNRINNFLVAYTPPYEIHSYFPSFGEISVTLGFVALEVLFFRFFVIQLPIVSVPDTTAPQTKFSIRG